MHIGLIGGIGQEAIPGSDTRQPHPAATVVCYKRLVRRFRATGRVRDLTTVQADAGTRVAPAAVERDHADGWPVPAP